MWLYPNHKEKICPQLLQFSSIDAKTPGRVT
jgi:hypothetical protein